MVGEGSLNSDWLALQREAIVIAKDSIQSAIDTQVLEADHTREAVTLKTGDKVLVHKDFLSTPVSRDQLCGKLKPRWCGSFTVIDTTTRSTARLDLPTWCCAHCP